MIVIGTLILFISSMCVCNAAYLNKYSAKQSGSGDSTKESGSRVSDPHIWNEFHNWDSLTANVTLPPGKPDTMDTDIPGSPLTPDDFQRGKVIVYNPIDTSKQPDPIEFAGLYQGDIDIKHMNHKDLPIKDFPPDYHELIPPESTPRRLAGQIIPVNNLERSAVTDKDKRWPNGVVPYVLSSTYNEEERALVAKAMTQFQDNTCIKFVPRISEDDYIHILKGDGCSSSVGKVGGAQQLSLGLGCIHVGIIMHEFVHSLGFWHEQSREDREKHIEIIWTNIQNGMKYNFQKYDGNVIQNLGPYDTGSIMHYGPYAFAKERTRPTIIAKTGGEIGQRRGFSKIDIQKVKELYKCGETGLLVTETPVSTQPPDLCEDSHKLCTEWAKNGECEENSMWMTVFCMKSCNQCGKECSNYSPFCEYWAKKEECMKNPMYMHHFCKMSCGLCHKPSAVNDVGCVDQNEYCQIWSTSGQCHINPTYMLKHCRKSCKEC